MQRTNKRKKLYAMHLGNYDSKCDGKHVNSLSSVTVPMATEPVLGPNTIVYELYPSGGTDTRKCSRYGAVSLPGSISGTTGSSWAGTGCTERKVVHDQPMHTFLKNKFRLLYGYGIIIQICYAWGSTRDCYCYRFSQGLGCVINAPARWTLIARQTPLNIL